MVEPSSAPLIKSCKSLKLPSSALNVSSSATFRILLFSSICVSVAFKMSTSCVISSVTSLTASVSFTSLAATVANVNKVTNKIVKITKALYFMN